MRYTLSSFLGGIAAFAMTACLLVTPLNEQGSNSSAGAAGSGGAAAGTGGTLSTGGTTDAGPGSCNENSDCKAINAFSASFCRPADHRCIKLATLECPVVHGSEDDWSNKNAIIFGAYAPLSKSDPTQSSTVVFNYEFARNELSGPNVGGLRDRNDQRHPLVTVVCNNDPDIIATKPEYLQTSLKHLVNDLNVPAIVGYLLPGELRVAFETYGKQNNVFFLSPIGASLELANLPDDGLLWHMLGQPGDLAPAYGALLKRLEPFVTGVFAVTTIKVAVVTSDDPFSQDLAAATLSKLVFNGKSLLDNGDNYRPWNVNADNPAQVGAEIAQFRPNIVISLAGLPFSQAGGVLAQIEKSWAPGKRPYYILSPLNAGDLGTVKVKIHDLSLVDSNTYQRFLGINVAPPTDRTLYYDYLTRFKQHYSGVVEETENFYDAIYYLAYAMQAAGPDQPLSGLRIRDGMRRLLGGGQPYSVGPFDIGKVFGALNDGQPIELIGTLGPPNFDTISGARIDTGAVFCFKPIRDPSGQVIGGDVAWNVLRYDLTTSSLTGDFTCYAGL
ncbi:MAG TPA: hypothetical protein VF881_11295 [Polyangiaceae bacterium]